jgi:hypothetical protein
MASPTTPIRHLAVSSQQITPPLTPSGSFDTKDLKETELTPPPCTPPDLPTAQLPRIVGGTTVSAPLPDFRDITERLKARALLRPRSHSLSSSNTRSPPESEEEPDSEQALCEDVSEPDVPATDATVSGPTVPDAPAHKEVVYETLPVSEVCSRPRSPSDTF